MKKKIALVLSGGGARGIAHIGVIEELQQRGYKIASIAGSSMGALVGGMFAAGKLEEFKKWMYSLDKMKVISPTYDFYMAEELVEIGRLAAIKSLDEFEKGN